MSNLGWSGGCLINLTCWTVCQGLQSLLSPLHRKGEVSRSRGSQGGSLSEAQRPASGGGGKGQSSMSEPNLSRNGQFDFSLSEFGLSVFL